MYAVKLVYLPQWDLEFFKNFARQELPICMTYAAFSYLSLRLFISSQIRPLHLKLKAAAVLDY